MQAVRKTPKKKLFFIKKKNFKIFLMVHKLQNRHHGKKL